MIYETSFKDHDRRYELDMKASLVFHLITFFDQTPAFYLKLQLLESHHKSVIEFNVLRCTRLCSEITIQKLQEKLPFAFEFNAPSGVCCIAIERKLLNMIEWTGQRKNFLEK